MILLWWSFGVNSCIFTNTTSISSSWQSDISWFSPSWSPRVLYLPISTNNTYQQDCMIDASSTTGEYSTSVGAPFLCINSNWNRMTLNSICKASASTVTCMTTDLEASSFNFASLIFCHIWVGTFSGDSVGLDILQGTWWPSSIASLVSLRSAAINKLLLWKIGWWTFD